jgi:hypothetical protein
MVQFTDFTQECPVCGRSLRIRVSYLGKRVHCCHCRGAFLAADPGQRDANQSTEVHPLLQRADQLLAMSSLRTTRQLMPAVA